MKYTGVHSVVSSTRWSSSLHTVKSIYGQLAWAQAHKGDYLQINAFLASSGRVRGVTSISTKESYWEPMVAEWEESRALQMKAISGSRSERWEKGPPGRSRPGSWDVNISFFHWSSTEV